MSHTANQLYETALTLPYEERRELAERLWVSLDATEDGLSVAEAWEAEIKRRVEAAERGEGHWLTEEEVNQRLEAKYGPLQD